MADIAPGFRDDSRAYENPITGNRIRFLNVPQQTDEGVLTYEVALAPGQQRPPFELRKRPQQTQTLLVTEGALRGGTSDQSDNPEKYEPFVQPDDEESRDPTSPLRITTGQEIHLARGVGHTFRNEQHDAETEVIVQLTPPLDTYQWIINGYNEAYRRVGQPTPMATALPRGPAAPRGETESRLDEPGRQQVSPRKQSGPAPQHHSNTSRSPGEFPSLLDSVRHFLRPNAVIPALFCGVYSLFAIVMFAIVILRLGIGLEHARHNPRQHLLYTSLSIGLFIPIMGYLARISRHALYGYESKPTFRDVAQLLIVGSKIAVVVLIFFFYPAVAFGMVLFGPGGGFIARILEQSFGTILSAGALYVFPAVYLRVVETGSLRSSLSFTAIGPMVLRRSYFRGHAMGALFLLAILGAIRIVLEIGYQAAGVTGVILGAIVGITTLFYGFIILSDYFGKVWIVVMESSNAESGSGPLTTRLLGGIIGALRSGGSNTPAAPRDQELRLKSPQAEFNSSTTHTPIGRMYELYENGLLTSAELEQKKRSLLDDPVAATRETRSPSELPDSADELLEQLHEQGLLDDREYAAKRGAHSAGQDGTIDPDIGRALETLRELHDLDVLSDQEFKEKTKRLLAGR